MTEFIIFIQSRRAHETIPRSVKILYKRGVSWMSNLAAQDTYMDFIKSKKITFVDYGFKVERELIHNQLYDFQKDIVVWALKKGKSAIFADCGLGKTLMQLEWARHVYNRTGKPILIVAPLAVTKQTQREGLKIDLHVQICRKQADIIEGINITNYEMLEHFNADGFIGVVLDESSILKAYSGTTKQKIISMFKSCRYKLACTATPSPNDHMEILNHSEFLDSMKSTEALAIWFINDTSQMGTYKLKGHAVRDFWMWVASWAVSLSLPSDLGFENDGFVLPKLTVNRHVIRLDLSEHADGTLFRMPEASITSYHREKRITAEIRAEECAKIVNSSDEIFCIWCETNYEADALKKAIPAAVEVRGNDSNKKKEQIAYDFIDGKIRVLIAKPKIFGFGMNFQVCHRVVFCGMSYSFESYYQAMRRFWRFGQSLPVTVDVVIGENEKNTIDVVIKKEHEFESLKKNMLIAMREFTEVIKHRREYDMNYVHDEHNHEQFRMILGDAIEETKQIETESVHFELFSPPFSQLYIYSDSYRDMGNCKSDDEFFNHFNYLIPEMYRTLKPGRLCAVHCKQLVNYKHRDGASGLRDFRGEIIRAFVANKFIYHSEVCIWKDPVIEMQRTKSHGLLYKQLRKDSTYSRQGLPEYLVVFRKWGEDVEPVNWKTHSNFELDKWQDYASPVWMSIRQTNVLNNRYGKDNKDEKHICPLQLDVIERAIELWTNPGDTVFSPFAGIGSEGFVSMKLKRKFIGIELKREYYIQAINNIKAIANTEQTTLLEELIGADNGKVS